jgi:hypothetical protein
LSFLWMSNAMKPAEVKAARAARARTRRNIFGCCMEAVYG